MERESSGHSTFYLVLFQCVLLRQGTIQSNSSKAFVVDSSYPLNLEIDVGCNVTKWFDDFGLYSWAIKDNVSEGCSAITVKEEPEHFWLNVAAVTSMCALLAIVYKLSRCVKNSGWFKRLRNGNTPFEELQAVCISYLLAESTSTSQVMY